MKPILIQPLIAVWCRFECFFRTNNELNSWPEPCLRSRWALAPSVGKALSLSERAACIAPYAEKFDNQKPQAASLLFVRRGTQSYDEFIAAVPLSAPLSMMFGMINTSEQLGGALGIAVLSAVELGINFHDLDSKLAAQGIHPTPQQTEHARQLIVEAEEKGINHVGHDRLLEIIKPDVISAHVHAFEVTFYAAGGIALLGALATFILVRKTDRVKQKTAGVFTRRSRWIYASSGRSPAITRRPPPGPGESATG